MTSLAMPSASWPVPLKPIHLAWEGYFFLNLRTHQLAQIFSDVFSRHCFKRRNGSIGKDREAALQNEGYFFFGLSFLFFLKIFLCFSVWGSFPCYLLHFGAQISDLHAICCILEPKSLICFWLLAFSFGFWLLAFAFGFWLLAFGWVLVLSIAYDISKNRLHINYMQTAH